MDPEKNGLLNLNPDQYPEGYSGMDLGSKTPRWFLDNMFQVLPGYLTVWDGYGT